jgi:uncharacterized protein (TIGR02145 family)
MIVIFKIVNGKKWCQICVTDKSKIINDDDDCIETFGSELELPAVMTEGICPSGWHIPSDGEWQIMEISLGMSESEASVRGWRGTDEGYQIKSTSGWHGNGNGSNSSGFNGLPGGFTQWTHKGQITGYYSSGNINGYSSWWSSSESGSNSWERFMTHYNDIVYRYNVIRYNGLSARCLRD